MHVMPKVAGLVLLTIKRYRNKRGADLTSRLVPFLLIFFTSNVMADVVAEGSVAKNDRSLFLPGRLIVTLETEGNMAVSVRADHILKENSSFRAATLSKSRELDQLVEKYRVRSARPLYDAYGGRDVAEAKRHYWARQDKIRARFSRRSARGNSNRTQSDPVGIYLFETDLDVDSQAACEAFEANPHVRSCVPDPLVTADAPFIPNDPDYPLIWAHENTGQSNGTPDADIDMPEAWGTQRGSNDIVVAVNDSGIDYDHPDIYPNLWRNPLERHGDANGDGKPGVAGVDDDGDGLIDEDSTGKQPGDAGYLGDLADDDDENGYVDDFYGWDFANQDNDPDDDNGHGTSCAGIIGAVGGNAVGVPGINHSVRLMAVKFLRDTGSGSSFDGVKATDYAVDNGADVINASYGGSTSLGFAQTSIQRAVNLGVVFVAAAGNDGDDTDVTPHYPSNYPVGGIISVAASDRNDNRSVWNSSQSSNYGPTTVELAAPGTSNWTTAVDGGYRYFNGTSSAAPHVAGVAALLLAQDATLSVATVKQHIVDTVDPLVQWSGLTITGGRLNASNALEQVAATQSLSTLEGNVTDEATLESISGASVTVQGPGWQVRSDSSGFYQLGVTAAAGNVVVSALGYQDKSVPFSASITGSTNTLAVTLAQAPPILLTGSILDEETGEGVDGQLLFYRNGQLAASVISSATSGYSASLPPGMYDIRVEPSGSYAQETRFNQQINAGVLDLELTRYAFLNITGSSGLAFGIYDSPRGGAWFDFDEDGLEDLYISQDGDPGLMWRNLGGQLFSLVSVGTSNSARKFRPVVVDYDGDGDRDIYEPVFGQSFFNGDANVFYENTTGSFTEIADSIGLADAGSSAYAAFVDLDGDQRLDVFVTNNNDGPSRYYRQDVNGTYVPQFLHSYISNVAIAYRPVFADMDDDGDEDLIYNYALLENEGGVIVDVTELIPDPGSLALEGPAVGDYDNDGDLDILFAGNSFHDTLLLRNDGSAGFADVTLSAGLSVPQAHHQYASWVDYDNDGDLDCYLDKRPVLNSPGRSMLFRNEGDGTFKNVSAATTVPAVSSAAGGETIWSDIDNDGDLDFYSDKNIYENLTSGRHWFKLELIGAGTNPDAIGATVRLTTDGISQRRDVTASTGNSHVLHFGLNDVNTIDNVTIEWPDGALASSMDLPADSLANAVQGSDPDADSVDVAVDNCPNAWNPLQQDADGDGTGNACDGIDDDNDGWSNTLDNCPLEFNPRQIDTDGNGVGDTCQLPPGC